MPLRWRPAARRGFAAVAAVVVASLALGLLIDRVSWSRSDGTVVRYAADVRVRPDGSVRVRESVRLRLDRAERAPAEQRELPTHAPGRRLVVDEVRLTDGEGDVLRPEITDLLRERRLRFTLPGEADDPVREYELSYTVRGASTPLRDTTLVERHLWSGFGRDVERARVTIRGGQPDTAQCMTGPPDGRRFCAVTDITDGRAILAEDDLEAAAGLAFSVRFEPALPDVPPVRAAEPPVATGSVVLLRGSMVLLLLLVIGAFAVLRQRSRPRARRRSSEPPVGVRPGEAGALLAGSAGPEHLTATLFDLVRRGHLTMQSSGEEAILQQRTGGRPRDELEQYEWSLLLKVFADRDEGRVSEVRATAPSWSYELLRELERRVTEDRGWRRSRRVTRAQRAGWLAAMGLVGLAYGGLALLSVTAWPQLPFRDLLLGAGVALLAAAGFAELTSRTADGVLTLRGRLIFADVGAWARYVDSRGVDGDDPRMGIWAVGLGVRPDPLALPVVPPSERSGGDGAPDDSRDRSRDGFRDGARDDPKDPEAEDPEARDGRRGSGGEEVNGQGSDDSDDTVRGDRAGRGRADHGEPADRVEGGAGAAGTGEGARERTTPRPDARGAPDRIFDDADDDLPLP